MPGTIEDTAHQLLDPQAIDKSIENFKRDLETHSADDMIRKHILFGSCAVIDDDQYFALKRTTASYFDLHTDDVVIVGSAKLGFSVAPNKRFRPFAETSDIDVAIISDELFMRVWRSAFEYWRGGGYWESLYYFNKYLFRGWIRPDKLPPDHTFQFARDWWEFFRSLSASDDYGPYKIAGAIYKDKGFLEGYQRTAVEACRGVM